MGEETTWFDLLPGVKNLELFCKHYLGRDHLAVAMLPSAFSISHVLEVFCVLIFTALGAFAFSAATKKDDRDAIVPPAKLTLRNLFEMFTDAVLNVATGVMGEENARRFLPLIGTLACFIFFSNIFALIPGFAPPTATLKTNAALALTVFVMTHVYGVMYNGWGYFKKFLGHAPVYLAPLMILIEIVSHLARPLSLSLRLLGNMAADHKVVAAFFGLVPLFVPVPFLILGVLVVIIQTMVFCLLAMVYIQGAVEPEHGHDHGNDHHAHTAHH
ncbi:MAG TPA: F0F1 ATP synthase subunit A [Polyangia bacterium]|jgi:F-type H+-transporting ATPase subunit a